jgi:hypothetical protein
MLTSFTKRNINGCMRNIRTIDDVVDALGGDTEVARWLNITPAGVNHWKSREEIPGNWKLRVYVRLLDEGFDCDPVVFGLSREDADILISRIRPVPRPKRDRSSAHA